MSSTTNTSPIAGADRSSNEPDLHLRVLAADGAIVLGCRGCGVRRVIGTDRPARSIQHELTTWCGQHYDCASGALAPQGPQEAAGSTQAPMREVSIKAEAKRVREARKAFHGKLVDLFDVRPDDL